MIRLLLLLSLGLGACSGADAAPRPTPIADALFAVAQTWDDPASPDAETRDELDRIAAEVRRAMAQSPSASARSALSATIFAKRGFVREVTDQDLRFVFLPSVLKLRRGNCVGLGSLYLALGERLGWKIEGVMVPGHFFVRVHEPGERRTGHNVELLRRGEEMSDAWYRNRFPIPGGTAREYARPLASSEVVAVIEYDVGNERRRQGRWADAQRAYEQACKHFPDFAEAHASLGALAQLMGALDEARADYEAARRVNPNLPGIDQNLELLESEKNARRQQ